MSNNNKLLEVKKLKMHFPLTSGGLLKRRIGAIRAVDGIDFDIKDGETLGLVGESGCGKSTTARCVSQLHKPTSGEVLLEGNDITDVSRTDLLKARMDMQMIFQDPYASLNPRMTAGNIISEPLQIYKNRGMLDISKVEIIEKIESLMEKVGLSHHFRNRYPHEFSGGQRQRIGVARALALNPKLILADEPVSALDVSIQSQILNLLTDLREEMNLSYLFIAHDLAVIQHISDRVAVMYLGKIMEVSESKELYKKPLHPYTVALLSAVPIPDPKIERKRKRIILTGDVPSPDTERHNCYFYDRCPKSFDKCKDNIPALVDVGDNHQVACFLHHNKIAE
jgi:oligopeptide transport system ATP-binding protein